MTMFDIKNSKNINLTDNETTGRDFAKIENVEDVTAIGNKMNFIDGRRLGFFSWIKENILKTVLVTVITVVVTGVTLHFFPWFR